MSNSPTQDSTLADYLTTTRTAKMLGVTPCRVRRMAQVGRMEAVISP